MFGDNLPSSNLDLVGSLQGIRDAILSWINGYLAPFTGAIKRAFSDKLSDIVSVKDFGAVGDGTTDDTTKIQAAINAYVALLTVSKGAMLYIPRGDYKLTAQLTLSAASNVPWCKGVIYGDGMFSSTFTMSGAFALFSATLLTQFVFRDIGFNNGTKAVTFNTQNTDQSIILFQSCHFSEQTTVHVEAVSGSNSTELLFDFCLFGYTGAGNQNAVISYCDYTRLNKCWIGTNTTGSVLVTHGALEVDALVGVPSGGSGSTACWVESYSHVHLFKSRFGSEDNHGRPIIWQKDNAASVTVRVEDCYVPCDTYQYKFDKAPEHLILRGNTGYGALGAAGGKGLWFKSTSASTRSFMERGVWELDDLDFPATGYFVDDGTNTASMCELAWARFSNSAQQEKILSTQVLFADALISLMSDARPTDTSNTGMAIGTGTYPLLGGFTAKKLTCTTAPGTYVGNNDLVTGTTDAGINTAVVDCYVTGATRPFWFDAKFQNNFYRQIAYNGLNVFCFRFQPDSTFANQTVTYTDIPISTVILLGRMRTFIGAKNIKTVDTVYSDLSTGTIPNTAYIYHAKGDVIEFVDCAQKALCVTAGQPGTFAYSKPQTSVVTETNATRTVLRTDSDIICNRAGTVTLTLLAAATFPGLELRVQTITANTVVSATSNVVPLGGGAAATAILAATAGKWAVLKSDGTNWVIMAAN